MVSHTSSTIRASVTLRPYRDSYRAAVEALAATLQDRERSIDPNKTEGKLIQQRQVDYLLQPLSNGSGILLVAEADGMVIGYVAARKESYFTRTYEWLYVDDLCVASAYRRQGIGSMLLAEVERYAREVFHVQHVRIGVLAGNDNAHRLYKSLGFVEQEIELHKDLNPHA